MNRKFRIPAIAALVLMALILLYAGLFLFCSNKGAGPVTGQTEESTTTSASVSTEKPAEYIHMSEIINGKKQEINILEVNPGAAGVRIVPALSHDLVYGFENLSRISERKKAYAAVNAGFFYDYGLPAGMVAADGTLFTLPTGKYPVFMISGGKAELDVFRMDMWLESAGIRIRADRLNMPPADNSSCIVYTPVYGATNRASGENYTITVEDGKVTAAGLCEDSTEIPARGMLITLFLKDRGTAPELSLEDRVGNVIVPALSLKKGDTVRLAADPPLSGDLQAYECGSWIVKDGSVVIGEKDAWIGVTTNNDPRTAVGLKDDGTVVLLTVDGRQPGYSEGMTCSELGKFLLDYGVNNAAMLDGGASTEMIVEGRIVSKPSHKGQERPVGGGLVIISGQ